ncbi:hypothetical protein H312_02478 [Anncaliia algerae PRA339]|uniref:ISXO2-like transposase domain-containing protein n=1 Tax=Anncaliia algerae PRA339 TaxID=1288291 RepID=A0A059EZI7_9MICR|nr:hypothetical protein H312_02478 [Anncaliia algerae PRA339]
MIVEVDESFVGNRKYNIGRVNNQKLIHEGIFRNSKRFFMKIISGRNKRTVGKDVESHIIPGTNISLINGIPNYTYYRQILFIIIALSTINYILLMQS